MGEEATEDEAVDAVGHEAEVAVVNLVHSTSYTEGTGSSHSCTLSFLFHTTPSVPT